MDLKVNHSELNIFCNKSKTESEILKSNIDLWQKKIEELKSIWVGSAADEFYNNVTNYCNKLYLIPNFYDSINEFISSANQQYTDADFKSKIEFEKITDDVGDYNV